MRNILFIIGLFTILEVNAQETVPLTLEKVLELSGANNLTIKEYKERQELSLAHLAKAREWWLPEIYAGAQTHQLWGAVMNGNGRFFLDVNRNNLWLGIGANANWDFAEGIYGTKSVKLQNQASEFLTAAERNNAILESVKTYYDLLTAQLNLVAYKNLVAQSDSIVQQIQIQVDAGLLYQSEVLLAKSNKNHLQVELLNAQKSYNQHAAKLTKLLNLSASTNLVSVDSILMPLDYNNTLQENNDSSLANHPEIKAFELEIQSLQIKKKDYTTGLWFPELSIGANTGYFGRLSGDLTPMDAVAFPNPNQLNSTQFLNVSLLWKIPLGTFTYNGDNKKYNSLIKIKEIESQRFKAELNEEISNATSSIEIGKKQISITKEAYELTAQALQQSIARQKLGTAKPFEVFQAQEFFLQAQLDYLMAISEYNKAQFELKVANGEGL